MQQFASDNNAGICPEALEALIRANAEGHAVGYGDDAWTQKACDRIRELFETDCEVFFVFNGTAANALALAQVSPPLPRRHRPCAEPHRGGRGRRRGTALRRRQDRHGGDAARQADAGHRRRPRGAGSRRAPRETPRAVADQCHGARHRLLDRRGRGADRGGAPARPRGAHGRRPLRQCARASRLRAGGPVLARRGRRAVPRRGQERARGRRGRAVLRPRAGGRVRVAGQAGGPPQLQDAARHRALGGAARGRPVAAQRAPRQRHGRAAVGAHRGLRGRAPDGAGAVERGVRRAAGGGAGEPARDRGWRFYTFLGETGCRLMCAWDTTPDTVDRFAADVWRRRRPPSPPASMRSMASP